MDKLESIIHNIRFATLPSRLRWYRCTNCGYVAINHFGNAECEHLICGRCHDNKASNLCPACNGSETVIWQKPSFTSAVMKLEAFCPFQKNGCDQTVCLEDYLHHVECCCYSERDTLTKAGITQKNTVVETMTESMENVQLKTKDKNPTNEQLAILMQDLQQKMKILQVHHNFIITHIERHKSRRITEFSQRIKNCPSITDQFKFNFICKRFFENKNYHLRMNACFKDYPEDKCCWLVASVECVQERIPLDEQCDYGRLQLILEDQINEVKQNITLVREKLLKENFIDWMKRFSSPFKLAPKSLLEKENPYVSQDSIVIRLEIEPIKFALS